MAKIANVYKDKDTKKWFYKKRAPKDCPTGKSWYIKKGFDTATKAKFALDKYLLELQQLEQQQEESKSAIAELDIKNDVMLEGFAYSTLLSHFEKNPHKLDEYISRLQKLKAELKGKNDISNTKLETFAMETAYPFFERTTKDGTAEGKLRHLKHIFNYFGEKTFNEIGKKDIAGFRRHLIGLKNPKGEPIGSMYINLILCTLGQVYDLACEEGLEINIARQIKGLPQKAKTAVDYWTLPEFENFLSVINTNTYKGYHQHLGFYMLFFSGLRVGEMMARKWTDVDWENNAIYIDSTLTYKNRNNWSANPKDGAKTASSRGWVKLTPKTMELLRVWKQMQEKLGKMDYIFMSDGTMFSPNRWTYWKDKYRTKWNKQATDDQQLKFIRVHDLRDSHGMFLLKKGSDVKTIQKKLRHAKATTTMNYYLDKLPGVEENILQAY